MDIYIYFRDIYILLLFLSHINLVVLSINGESKYRISVAFVMGGVEVVLMLEASLCGIMAFNHKNIEERVMAVCEQSNMSPFFAKPYS